jgi:hypothetical protein
VAGVAEWSSSSWLAAAVEWIDSQVVRTGPVSQPHLRPWSTVLRVPVRGDGSVWMKATGDANAFEAGLYELLVRIAPERVLTPIAVDAERGWLLLPDGGQPMGERLEGPELVDAMAAALAEYGRLQRTLAPHVDELIALGVADMRPAVMPERFEQALDAVSEPLRRRVEPLRGTVAEWCSRLAASPVPASLDHNDLHPWNVLDGNRFYDWGDAVIAHPFAATFVPLGVVRYRLGAVEDDHPALLRARDAYLSVFSDLAPHASLVDELETACHVAKIARALVWERAIRAAREQSQDLDPNWDTAVDETLEHLLDESYLGAGGG